MLTLTTLFFTATLATPSLANDVHIVSATGSGDHTTIQQALNSAADGDIILVRPGTYPSFVVDNLDVTICADGGFVYTGTIRVRDLAADKVLVIDGLDAQGVATSSPSSARGAWFIDCAGSIRVQHSSFIGADSFSVDPEDGWDGAFVEHCLDVSFTDCLLVGGIDSGEYAANTGVDTYGGGNGLYASNSLVSVYASEARAGDGHFSVYWDGGEGGDGALLEAGSRLLAHSSTFEGGDGGGTHFNMGYGQDGGHGVYARTGSSADVIGGTLIAGQGGNAHSCGFCGAGEDGYPDYGDTTLHSGDVRDLCLIPRVGALREGASAVLTVNSYASSRASLIYSFGADRRELGPPDRLLLLASPFVRLLPAPAPRPIPLALPARNFLGFFSSTGSLNVTFQAGDLPPGVEGERVLAQPFHVPTTGGWNLGAPLVIVILDSAV
jgi:hypothetical protein